MIVRKRKQLIQIDFLERGHAQNLQKCIKRDRKRQVFFDDRSEDINRDRNPYLCLHRVFRGPIECLDPEVLLDPAEKQLDLPAELVKQGDGQSGKNEVVCQECQIAAVFPVVKPNATKAIRVVLSSIESAEDDRLIRA